MTDWDLQKYVAVYDRFEVSVLKKWENFLFVCQVGPAEHEYELTVGGFNSGLSTLGDSLSYHSGKKFSTKISKVFTPTLIYLQ